MAHLVIDMMSSISLGYSEHVIAIFKSLVEEYSVFFAVGSAESQEEFDNLKQGYWISSRLQLGSHFEKTDIGKKLMPNNEIKDIYDDFYKERYGLDNYKKFYWEFRRNSLQNTKNDHITIEFSLTNIDYFITFG